MPVQLDLLTRVRNIHWGGGKFVAGSDRPDGAGDKPAVFYSGADAKTWEVLTPFPDFGTIWSGSYHESAWLLGGDDGAKRGLIMRSKNGRDWTAVHRVEVIDDEFFINSSILAIVWDENAKAFFAEGSQFENGRPTGPQQVNMLYQSENGTSWTEVGRKTFVYNGLDFAQAEKEGLIVPHCTGKVKDWKDTSVPDGVYGESNTVLIAPTDPVSVNYASGSVSGGSQSTVRITRAAPGGGTSSKTVNTGVPFVNAVAYAGGIWIATGQNQIARSVDAGDTWTIVLTGAEPQAQLLTAIARR
jgi:hypothetical protein